MVIRTDFSTIRVQSLKPQQNPNLVGNVVSGHLVFLAPQVVLVNRRRKGREATEEMLRTFGALLTFLPNIQSAHIDDGAAVIALRKPLDAACLGNVRRMGSAPKRVPKPR